MKKINQPKKETISSPKGMRDIIGDEYYNYQGLFEKAQEVAIYYGFKPIETPILEHEEVFTSGVGAGTDIVDKEMYSLKTKGGDKLALRPEATAAVMRAYIEHGMQSTTMGHFSGTIILNGDACGNCANSGWKSSAQTKASRMR